MSELEQLLSIGVPWRDPQVARACDELARAIAELVIVNGRIAELEALEGASQDDL